jgi:hypothetical protein
VKPGGPPEVVWADPSDFHQPSPIVGGDGNTKILIDRRRCQLIALSSHRWYLSRCSVRSVTMAASQPLTRPTETMVDAAHKLPDPVASILVAWDSTNYREY